MTVQIKIHKRKIPRRLYLLLLLLLIPVLIIVFSLLYKKEPLLKEKDVIRPPQIVTASLIESKETIQRGITLTDILKKYHFQAAEIHQLREEIKPVFDLNKIKAGQEMRFFLTSSGTIHSIEYDLDKEYYLLIWKEEGKFRATIREFPIEVKTEMIWGAIEDNLISAFDQKNEEDILALSLAELFAWDIDFYTDLRQGDAFKIIFEKKFLKNKFVGYGNILAAEFINQGKIFYAFRYTYPDTKKADYFDHEGNSLRKEFLKSPIKFARITSRFRLSRLHPIHKVYRSHFGVDYGARIGTPVQATADGTVSFVGWNGASGRMVKIRHKNAYETMYLHLHRFSQGIEKGAKVKGGQEIGKVGSSGESTGPHLDYRIKYRDKYINPLSFRFKPVEPLRPEFLEDFKREVEKYLFFFEAPLSLVEIF